MQQPDYTNRERTEAVQCSRHEIEKQKEVDRVHETISEQNLVDETIVVQQTEHMSNDQSLDEETTASEQQQKDGKLQLHVHVYLQNHEYH